MLSVRHLCEFCHFIAVIFAILAKYFTIINEQLYAANDCANCRQVNIGTLPAGKCQCLYTGECQYNCCSIVNDDLSFSFKPQHTSINIIKYDGNSTIQCLQVSLSYNWIERILAQRPSHAIA
jgi:hypothetical protein